MTAPSNREHRSKFASWVFKVALAMSAPLLFTWVFEAWVKAHRLETGVSVVSFMVLVFLGDKLLTRFRRGTRLSVLPDETHLDALTRELAGAVGDQWAIEADICGFLGTATPLLDPTWHTLSHRQVEGQEATGTMSGLPALFDSIEPKLLVILGDPEAGKTSSALYLANHLLKHRAAPTDPVPVIVSLADWSPDANLIGWLAERLAAQHSWLTTATAAYDKGACLELIQEGRILPVLDGLDEVPGETAKERVDNRRKVLKEISLNTGRLPGAVVSSRPEEFRQAEQRQNSWLKTAATVELERLSPDQICDYLDREVHPDLRPRWDNVTKALKEGDRFLGTALSTPFMLGLAPSLYAETWRHPNELLDFTDAERLRTHLAQQFAPSRFTDSRLPKDRSGYQPPQKADAMRWLVFLARSHQHTDGTPKAIQWWKLSSVSAKAVGLLAALIAFLLAIGTVGLGSWMVLDALGQTGALAWGAAATLGAITGMGLGIASAFNGPPEPAQQLRAKNRWRAALKLGLPTSALAVVAGLRAFGFGEGLLVGLVAVPVAITYAFAGPDATPQESSPESLLRKDLKNGLWFAAAYGVGCTALAYLFADSTAVALAFGLSCALIGSLFNGPLWILLLRRGRSGAVGFLHLGLTVLVRAPRGDLPWRVLRFLREAHRRGILRRDPSGGSYVFRQEVTHRALVNYQEPNAREVRIWLAEAEHSAQVEGALTLLFDEVGLEVSERDEPQSGSWYRRLVTRVRPAGPNASAEQVAAELERKIRGEIWSRDADAPTASAAASLIEALRGVESACIQVGSLLVVKYDGATLVRNLTQFESETLRRDPALLHDPAALLGRLEVAARRAESAGTAE